MPRPTTIPSAYSRALFAYRTPIKYPPVFVRSPPLVLLALFTALFYLIYSRLPQFSYANVPSYSLRLNRLGERAFIRTAAPRSLKALRSPSRPASFPVPRPAGTPPPVVVHPVAPLATHDFKSTDQPAPIPKPDGPPATTKASKASDMQLPQPQQKSYVSDERVLSMTGKNNHLIYVRAIDTVLMTMAKGGSSSVFGWIYIGMTGKKRFSSWECHTYVQNISSPCWNGNISPVHRLPLSEQRRVLIDPDGKTLRIAVQRDPFDRLISSFRDKISCKRHRHGPALEAERTELVGSLRHLASLPENMRGAKDDCMKIDEFATVVNAMRNKIQAGRISTGNLDVHMQPQKYFFDEIDYDLVLDIADLNDVRKLQPLLARLPFRHLDHVKKGPGRAHTSNREQISISAASERLLRNFAELSKFGEKKFSGMHSKA